MDIILENKVVSKLKFSKNVKKCAPKMIFFNLKKNRKIQIIFDIENLFKGLVVGFGPKGRSGRVCDSVR